MQRVGHSLARSARNFGGRLETPSRILRTRLNLLRHFHSKSRKRATPRHAPKQAPNRRAPHGIAFGLRSTRRAACRLNYGAAYVRPAVWMGGLSASFPAFPEEAFIAAEVDRLGQGLRNAGLPGPIEVVSLDEALQAVRRHWVGTEGLSGGANSPGWSDLNGSGRS